ncbi:MAG TPA: hypothetical protein VF179_24110 [Thermoanaerobaculia bacterium]|nr:hypothetical protein [Thermoanaerobaculia bacterium]
MNQSQNMQPAPLSLHPRGLLNALASRLPRNVEIEEISTEASFHLPAGEVCNRILLYEEVPGRPGLFLRLLLPLPIRSEGNKSETGALVRCVYSGGHLVKRITDVQAGRLVEFEVLEQELGIEGFATLEGGSYRILERGASSEVILTTRYCGHLRPRWFWRTLERLFARGVHDRILQGMRSSSRNPKQQAA